MYRLIVRGGRDGIAPATTYATLDMCLHEALALERRLADRAMRPAPEAIEIVDECDRIVISVNLVSTPKRSARSARR